MPIPAILPAAMALIGQKKQNAMNIASTLLFNKMDRDYQDHVYGKQRADSLADWNMVNEYNSPAAQMARYKAAGLNPNLIYGQTNEAPSVRSSSPQSWHPQIPQVTQSVDLSSFQDMELKTQQVNNLKATEKVIMQDAANKAVQGAIMAKDAQLKGIQLKYAEDNALASLEAARLSIRGQQQQQILNLREDERRAALNSASIREAAERILSIRAQRAKTKDERDEIIERIKTIKNSQELQQIEINLRKQGINPNDPAWQRWLQRLLGEDVMKVLRAEPGGWLLPKTD